MKGADDMEKKYFTIFTRNDDGTATARNYKAYTVDEAEDKALNAGYKVARYETTEYYMSLHS